MSFKEVFSELRSDYRLNAVSSFNDSRHDRRVGFVESSPWYESQTTNLDRLRSAFASHRALRKSTASTTLITNSEARRWNFPSGCLFHLELLNPCAKLSKPL